MLERRDFLTMVAGAGLLLSSATTSVGAQEKSFAAEGSYWNLPKLGYGYTDLEPHIDGA